MEMETTKQFAHLLRAAAAQTISEPEFWDKFNKLESLAKDPFGRIVNEAAIHFWGNFHERNLLLIRTKPDRYQLQQGKDELNLIAEGLEADWSVLDLKSRLTNV